ncbi:hypothetical protein [Microbacterium sp. NPDC089696]|uniref:hypothetical protein n=1 Tax=Microbacterium sp. NPDC089696 TaxID=3364199 RepID=UPI0038082FB0
MIRRSGLAAAAVVVALLVTPMTLGAAAPHPQAGFCIPLIYCPDPDPEPGVPPESPTPTAPADPADPSMPVVPLPTDPIAPVDPAPADPVPAPVDDGAPVFTGTPAAMGSESLSFSGLSGISIVTVPTADGGGVRVLKLTADSITISGFSLTVRPPDGPGLVTTADTMSLQGHVSVYLGSVSASALGGEPLTIGLDTPPPLTDIEPGLLNVTMGLVGSTADSITYTNTDQRIVELD